MGSRNRGRRPSGRPSSAKLTPEVQAKIDSIQREFGRLQKEADLAAANEAVSRIDERVAEYPADLSALQRRGFLHSRQIQERLDLQKSQWRRVEPRLRSSLRQQKRLLRTEVTNTARTVTRARAGRQSAVSAADKAVDALKRKVDAAERELRNQYSNIDTELYAIESTLRDTAWMMDALEESPDIRLKQGEGPLRATKSEWHRDGDEGPEGILYLTDQRLFFEQKEEVVTKKRFGVFKSESEMVHKLWLDINVSDIDSVEDKEEGGFLGMGKADVLEMTCSGQAPISRARFHIKGQESSDWRALIRRAQSGEVAAEKGAGVESAPALTFPTTCPNCFASLPEPNRGATQVICEYCSSAVGPVQEG
jgi:hypothetical protein